MNKRFLIILLLHVSASLFAQQYHREEGDDPARRSQKIGVKIGFCETWLQGNTLQNMRPQTGIQGGVYYRVNLNKHLNFQTEIGASYKGARFNNNDSGYSRLSLFYMDIPFYLMVNFNEKNSGNLFFGPQVSCLLKPSLFIGKDYFAAFTELPVRNVDYFATIGYHKNFDIVGLQIAFKYGLRNIAKNFNNYPIPGYNSSRGGEMWLNDVKPSLRELNSLRNFSVEVSISF